MDKTQQKLPWGCFLHFYQPANQQEDILEAIVNQSYRRVLSVIENSENARVTVTFTGSLFELLEKYGYKDVIEKLGRLIGAGKVELVGTAKYHAFLPLLPDGEIERQVELQEKSAEHYFGSLYQRTGFFSPELAYDPRLVKIVKELGFRYTLAEDLAHPGGKPSWDKFYVPEEEPEIKVFFRHKRASSLILSAVVRSAASLFEELSDERPNLRYLVTVMDAETFGHHRVGHEKILGELFDSAEWQPTLLRDLTNQPLPAEKIRPRACTWSNEEQDFWLDKERTVVNEHPFLLWQDPNNPIHKLQWEFLNFTIGKVGVLPPDGQENWQKARAFLDRAEASDPFWWASAKPWWSLEMIELGAYELKEVINLLPSSTAEDKQKSEKYYREILDIAFSWQRSGEIRRRHREKYKTTAKISLKQRTPPHWYNILIREFDEEMRKAAANLDFEKAIKWRDAIIKLKEGLDIYDILHVVDELRLGRKIPSSKPLNEIKPGELSELAVSAFLPEDGKKGK